MIKVWLDHFLLYVADPDKLPAILDEADFSKALIPRKIWKTVYPIMQKKGFAIARVVLIEEEPYDEWTYEI